MQAAEKKYDFDYFVIGGGSGGVRTARIAAAHGAKVALAEEKYMGGTCVNVGCVPKKLMTYAAHFACDIKDARGYGWTIPSAEHSWSDFIEAKNKEIHRLNNIYENMLKNAGVQVLHGKAIFEDEHTIKIGPDTYTADKIVIATGGKANRLDHNGCELGITSDEFFYLKERPERALFIGAGYISLEFACVLNRLGTHTTVFHRGDKVLRGFDEDLREHLGHELEKQGIDIVYEAPGIMSIEKDTSGKLLVSTSDGKQASYDMVLYGVGRLPNIEGLGLEKIGVNTDAEGVIKVDDHFKTSVDHIYAIGDVTNIINLTPAALAQGHVLADNLFGGMNRSQSWEDIPTAVFTNPPLATCGPTEEEAKKKYGKLRVYCSEFRPMKYVLANRDEKTFMKLLVDDKTDKVVGAHMMGTDTPEMMQAIGVAIKAGATKADFDATIGIHPTSAEEFVTLRSVTRVVE